MQHDILLSGYYGFGNTGDEAILQSICDELRRLRPNINLAVLIDNTETAASLNLSPYPRKSLSSIFKALSNTKVLLSGGGGLIQDSTGINSVLYYLGLAFLAKLKGPKAVMCCQGFGPVSSFMGKIVAKRLLPCFYKATVRDEDSLNEVKLFAPNLDLTLSADPALILQPEPLERADTILEKSGVSKDHLNLILVSVRNWEGVNLDVIVKALEEFASGVNDNIHFAVVPFQPSKDTDISLELVQKLKGKASLIADILTPKEILSVTAHPSVKMVVSMRLHALIFAAAQNVPHVGISYDPKVQRFCRAAGSESLNLADLDPRELALMLNKTYNNREAAIKAIASKTEILKEKARQALADIVELI